MHLANPVRLYCEWTIADELAAFRERRRRAAEEAVVQSELAREGITARCLAVAKAIATPGFDADLNAAIASGAHSLTDLATTRALALEVLSGRGIQTDDVHFTLAWGGDHGVVLDSGEVIGPKVLRFSTPCASPYARERAMRTIADRQPRLETAGG